MYTISKTADNVIDALADFIDLFVAGDPVIRGQSNRTPMPSEANFVVLTEVLNINLDTVTTTNTDPANNIITLENHKQIDVQIDFYGPTAGDRSFAFLTGFRSSWGFNQMPDWVKPLYASDAHNSPLTSEEEQYLARWTITASLQYNPTIEVNQQFADELNTTIKNPADLVG